MDDWVTIGARLRGLRKGRGLTQADFAAIAGITRSHIAKVEKGSDRLSLDALGLLADEFETSIACLIGEAENAPEKGDDDPVSQTNAEVLAAYAAISEEGRKAVMDMMKAMAPKHTGELPPVRINRLMGHVPLDDLDPDIVEQELLAALLAIRKRQAELQKPPPRPFQGGSVTENSVEDCRRARVVNLGTKKVG